MWDWRVKEHSVLGPQKERPEVSFEFNGQTLKGLVGEPIAVALLANGIRHLRVSERNGRPRGLYCAIGHCYECCITVNDVHGVRSCLTPLSEGMVLSSARDLVNRPFRKDSAAKWTRREP